MAETATKEPGMPNDSMVLRASDHDRQLVVDRLRAALEDGRLSMAEYVDRMGLAYQAVTYGDLAPLHADLPAAPAGPGPAGPGPAAGPRTAPVSAPALAGPPAARCCLPVTLRVLWAIWLAAVSVNVVVWILVSVTSGHLAYPWPLWVAGPYGALLAAVSVAVLGARSVLRPAR
jgi:hypothetical protein